MLRQASCKGISEEDADAYMLPFPTPAHAAGAAKWSYTCGALVTDYPQAASCAIVTI